jgi:hypothetical protein
MRIPHSPHPSSQKTDNNKSYCEVPTKNEPAGRRKRDLDSLQATASSDVKICELALGNFGCADDQFLEHMPEFGGAASNYAVPE